MGPVRKVLARAFRASLALGAGVAAMALVALAPGSLAQVGPGGALDPTRDCQTIRQCRFTPGGVYRGCISAYSCRVCRLVASRCTITGREQTCQRMRCEWG